MKNEENENNSQFQNIGNVQKRTRNKKKKERKRLWKIIISNKNIFEKRTDGLT